MKKLLLAMALSATAQAESVDIKRTWAIPTHMTDGSVLPFERIDNYTIYDGDGSVLEVVSPSTTSHTQTVESSGTYCVTATTTDIDGVEGPHSPISCAEIFSSPNSPIFIGVDISITISERD